MDELERGLDKVERGKHHMMNGIAAWLIMFLLTPSILYSGEKI